MHAAPLEVTPCPLGELTLTFGFVTRGSPVAAAWRRGHCFCIYAMQLSHVPRLQQLKLPVDPVVSPTVCTTPSEHKAWQLQQHVDCWTDPLPRASVACILEKLQ